MDGKRFDNFARRLSRRKAIGGLGATGLVAAASRVHPGSSPGWRHLPDVGAGAHLGGSLGRYGLCRRTGDHPGRGTLDRYRFAGIHRRSNGPVVGQADGAARALAARHLPNGNALVLTGTGENDIERCSGALSGVFGGPELGDTGSWLIDPGQSVRSGGGGSTPITPGTPVASPTVNPECAAVSCLDTSVMDPETCECLCPEHSEACGPLCCPGGSICLDEESGECACPDETELCGDWCEPVCESRATTAMTTPANAWRGAIRRRARMDSNSAM